MTSRPGRVGRPIASASLAMAKRQERQGAARASLRPERLGRLDSSDEDENNNRHRAPPLPLANRQQPQRLKRTHCSSLNLALRGCRGGGGSSSSSTSQQQLASCVTRCVKSAEVIEASASRLQPTGATQTKSSSSAGPSVRRASKTATRTQAQPQPQPQPQPQTQTTTGEPSKPLAQVNRLRWKSSTGALSCRPGACAKCPSAAASGKARGQHISERVSSRGQWCCELPHHATAAHLNTLRQSNLASRLNRVPHQEPSGLRDKRAASSLSLVGTNARHSLGDKSTRPAAAAASEKNALAPTIGSASQRAEPKPKPQAINRREQAPQASSQVTNSRLRQGALFARRQLHLLPARTLAASSPAQSREPGLPCARAPSVACVASRSVASRVQAKPPAGKPASTAAEARRRATRKVVVLAATRTSSGHDQPLRLVRAEKKASHLTSSSSSLSLSAFVVKRPRQQQSSTSSSCSSISTASRRWSASSGAQSPTLSQSCSRLTSNQADWPHKWSEHTPARSLVGSEKASSENLGPLSERARERPTHSTDECHQRARSPPATNGRQQHQPKQANGQTNLLGCTNPHHLDESDNLLDLIHIDHIANSIEPSGENLDQTAADESGRAARHAFQVQSDEKKPIDQQVKPRATIESSQVGDADIVAIGFAPDATVPALQPLNLPPPSPPPPPSSSPSASSSTRDNFATSLVTGQRFALHGTMATSATGCNMNECHPIVTSSNLDLTNDRLNDQEIVIEKNVDIQISLGGDVENINNNIDVNEAVGMHKGLISPLDSSSKTFSRNTLSQELTQAPLTGVKNQPLGLHQSLNIVAGSEKLTETPNSVTGHGTGIDEHFCAIDLARVQVDQTAQPIGDKRDSSLSVEKASLSAPPGEQDVIVARQKMAEVPIRLEPISDFYDLESRPFARGKFAQVKRCTRKSATPTMTLGECYAAKCIKKRRRLVDIRHEILLEIEALKLSFETEHIVRLYEVYETQTEMVLVLEMAKGGELQRVLDDEEQIEETLVRKMIDQILEGLIHLHDNEIAHLDIKPQNLLLSKPFPYGDIKLCDFGISRRISKDCEIREICGTPDYVAPEILRYDPISLATDMWSLGVLTYVLLSGYSPFGSDNKQQTFCNITQATLDFPQEIFAKISSEAVDFVRKLLVREPTERLTSRQARQHQWISNQRTAG